MTKENKSRGRKWDGKSRVSNDTYRKNFDEIFKKGIVGKDSTLGDVKKILEEIKDPFDREVKEKKISDKEFQKILDRNGF